MKQRNICFAIVALMLTLLSSCMISEVSHELRVSCDFTPKDRKHEPLKFYRLDNQYYLEYDVDYETINRNMYLGGMFGAKSIETSIDMHRKATERYYFLMPPHAVKYLFGTETENPDSDAEHCIAASEWDAENAVPVASSLKYADIDIAETYKGCVHHHDFNAEKKAFLLMAPPYRPWDYWIKQPLSVLVLIGVDIPVTLISPVFIVPYYALYGP